MVSFGGLRPSCENCGRIVYNKEKYCSWCVQQTLMKVKNANKNIGRNTLSDVDLDILEHVPKKTGRKGRTLKIEKPPFSTIFLRQASKVGIDTEITTAPKRELIVSRYNENTNWLNHIPDSIDLITLYNKGGNPGISSKHDERIRIVNLPNIGREAHTWLHHFISRRQTLADITYMAQGEPFMHSPDYLDLISFDYSEPTPLVKFYAFGHFISKRHGYMDLHKVDDRYLIRQQAFHSKLHMHDRFFASLKKNWRRIFLSEIPDPLIIYNGAMLALPRNYILIRSDKFYRKFIQSGISAYQAEGYWKYVFTESFKTKY